MFVATEWQASLSERSSRERTKAHVKLCDQFLSKNIHNMQPPDAKSATSFKIYMRLLGYLRPMIGLFAISLLGFVVFASSQPLLAAILKYFVDGLTTPAGSTFHDIPLLGRLDLAYGVPLMLILIVIWQGIGSFFGNYYLSRVSLGLINDLRRALFESLLHLPNTYFDQNNSGHLISRITYNVTMVTGAATEAIKIMIREGLTVVFLFGYLLWMNWKLTLVMVAILPVIGVMASGASRKFRKQSKKIQSAMGDLTHIASETIQGYRVVRSFGGENYETERFRASSEANTKKQLRMAKIASTFTPALQLVTFSTMSVLLLAVLLLRGDSSAGDLVAYITAAGMLPKPIRQLSEISATIQKGLAGAESIFAQLDEAPEIDGGTVERDRVTGRIEVRNLTFSYSGSEKHVLNDVSFLIEPGQMVALVGRSGSGKSTLASLIPRFYAHSQGQVLIDGIDVREYTLRNLRSHIALVTQQTSLFNDTVANNIAYGGLADAPRALIEEAAEAAYAREFVDQLPEGFDTLVGENGVLLSGGQRQRLAIARAILKDAPILILDEATSALDTESERHIQTALDQVTSNRTTLVIAHRLSTIEKADLILVMDQGRIVERGSHVELLAGNGHYARLHTLRFSEDISPRKNAESGATAS